MSVDAGLFKTRGELLRALVNRIPSRPTLGRGDRLANVPAWIILFYFFLPVLSAWAGGAPMRLQMAASTFAVCCVGAIALGVLVARWPARIEIPSPQFVPGAGFVLFNTFVITTLSVAEAGTGSHEKKGLPFDLSMHAMMLAVLIIVFTTHRLVRRPPKEGDFVLNLNDP